MDRPADASPLASPLSVAALDLMMIAAFVAAAAGG